MTHGFFTDSQGNKSSTRLIGFIVILYSLVLVTSVLVMGFVEKSSVLLTAAAAGTLFTTTAGPCMFYLFQNKKEELSNTDSSQKQENSDPK